ncbi:MAG: hypothetical protein COW47_00320 [Candidatus Huberarchaeum crystalense]|uniref:Uncharacterized protein n=1 Tax=Huberarchaeum crystalense TaxID=2014257 RepID=A0A2G9LJ92_HUBC1|nr:hypothetical protein [archaeon]OIP20799.1 MAG: hypothetical protein AUJ91_00285 [archaeon CG2_30_31_98]PIN66584.1 MAG: hypothetical protein COW69_01440 [Candidatus Huberarchaeum crystalense]NCS98145.1 hypothetical protein [archaeon]PIV13899.1 MAG: hypothetical protein COS45_00470 [Candidatus Huberarchaeum crystalense]
MIENIKINYVEAKKYNGLVNLQMFQVQNQPKLLELDKESDLLLNISFECSIEYVPSIGFIHFRGFLKYKTTTPDETNQMVAQWKQKKLDQNLVNQWLSSIFQICLIKSIAISEIVGLPIAIPLPNMMSKQSPQPTQIHSKTRNNKK